MKSKAAVKVKGLLIFPFVVASSLALLTSCSAPPESPNSAVCTDFRETDAALSVLLDTVSEGDPSTQAWSDDSDAFAVQFDELALRAEGDVKERLRNMVTVLPDRMMALSYSEYRFAEDYFMNRELIARACKVAGSPLDLAAKWHAWSRLDQANSIE